VVPQKTGTGADPRARSPPARTDRRRTGSGPPARRTPPRRARRDRRVAPHRACRGGRRRRHRTPRHSFPGPRRRHHPARGAARPPHRRGPRPGRLPGGSRAPGAAPATSSDRRPNASASWPKTPARSSQRCTGRRGSSGDRRRRGRTGRRRSCGDRHTAGRRRRRWRRRAGGPGRWRGGLPWERRHADDACRCRTPDSGRRRAAERQERRRAGDAPDPRLRASERPRRRRCGAQARRPHRTRRDRPLRDSAQESGGVRNAVQDRTSAMARAAAERNRPPQGPGWRRSRFGVRSGA
jgi:hypothetical protein